MYLIMRFNLRDGSMTAVRPDPYQELHDAEVDCTRFFNATIRDRFNTYSFHVVQLVSPYDLQQITRDVREMETMVERLRALIGESNGEDSL